MKNFRPSATIFEIGNTTKNDKIRSVMTEKRQMHHSVIDRYKQKKQIQDEPLGKKNFKFYSRFPNLNFFSPIIEEED